MAGLEPTTYGLNGINVKIAASDYQNTFLFFTLLYRLSYIPNIDKGGRIWTYISGLGR